MRSETPLHDDLCERLNDIGGCGCYIRTLQRMIDRRDTLLREARAQLQWTAVSPTVRDCSAEWVRHSSNLYARIESELKG